MASEIRENIMLAAMEGDLDRLLCLGREGLGYPLLLGGETLEPLGWSGPEEMPEGAAWEDYIRAGLAPAFDRPLNPRETEQYPIAHGFSVCRMDRPEEGVFWLVDIEAGVGMTVHLILSGKGREGAPPPEEGLLATVCLSVRTCLGNSGRLTPQPPLSAEKLLLQLVRNERVEEPLLRFHTHVLNMETEGLFTLLVTDLKGYHPYRNSIATIRTLLERATGGQSVIDGDCMIFLVSHERFEPAEQRAFWKGVADILDDNRLLGAFSKVFYHLGDFHYHFQHTLEVMRLRFCSTRESHLISCDEMTAYFMISRLRETDGPALRPHPALRRLMQSDREKKTAYVETLTAYLENAQKPVPTCARLHIHRNTLDYRLRRIGELTELDWSDGELMFRLYLSLCSLRYDRLTGAGREY